MSNSVLYDEPGPRAKRLSLIATLVVAAVAAVGIYFAVQRLADRGQFESELWNPVVNPSDPQFSAVWQLLGKGLLATLTAAVIAIALSLTLGTLLGVLRMSLAASTFAPAKVLLVPLVAAMEILRGLPVIISIFYVYILVRAMKWDISWLPGEDGLWFLVIGLTIYNMVIFAEILRAGVASLPRGQREAGLAIGLTPLQTMFSIQLPQAFRTMLPALISQLVVVLKDTSLVAVLGLYIELLRRGNLISQNLDNPLQMLFVVGLIFIGLNYLLSKLSEYVQKRSGRGPKAPKREPDGTVPPTPAFGTGATLGTGGETGNQILGTLRKNDAT